MIELQILIRQLRFTFQGTAWHGPSLQEIIEAVTLAQATLRIGETHNIAELVHHIYAWRVYVIHHLKEQNSNFEVAEDFNFIRIDTLDAEHWKKLKEQLLQSQEELLQLLESTKSGLLDKTVSRREFPFSKVLHGILHHDVYHAGQIRLLHKQVQQMNKA